MAARRGRPGTPGARGAPQDTGTAQTAGASGASGVTEDWISVADAAEHLGINRRTLTRAAQVGNLEARRVRQLWVTTLPAVQAWLRGVRHRPGPRPGRGRGRPRPPGTPTGEGEAPDDRTG